MNGYIGIIKNISKISHHKLYPHTSVMIVCELLTTSRKKLLSLKSHIPTLSLYWLIIDMYMYVYTWKSMSNWFYNENIKLQTISINIKFSTSEDWILVPNEK